MRPKRAWSGAEDKALRSMTDCTASEAARRLDRDPSVVALHARKLGIRLARVEPRHYRRKADTVFDFAPLESWSRA